MAIEAEKNRRLQVFRPKFETLVSLVSFLVEYPEDYHTLSKVDCMDFFDQRTTISIIGITEIQLYAPVA